MSGSRKSYHLNLQAIERLHLRLQRRLRRELARLEISDIEPSQISVLLNIGDDRLSVGELVRRGAYHQPVLSGQISRLREAGYIRHERTAQDKRVRLVSLTDKGQRLLEVLTSFYDQSAAELSASVDDATLGVCARYLQHLEQALQLAEDQPASKSVSEISPSFTSGVAASDDQEEQALPNLNALLEALRVLPSEQREALILTRAEDLTYKEAALVCGVAVGTIKSRTARAGERLVALLYGRSETAS